MENDFIRKIAIHTAIPKETVSKVINHSMQCLQRSSSKCSSLEITGFGTFYARKKMIPPYIGKIEKVIENLEESLNGELTERVRKNSMKRIIVLRNEIEELRERYENME